jgi:hypothetical protein
VKRSRPTLSILLGLLLASGCTAGEIHREAACERPPPGMKFLGAPLSVAEAEAKSLEEMKQAPHAPQVPFGYQNGKWESLKAKMLAGDALYKFTSGDHGGVVLIRNGCVVVLLIEWMV